MIAIGWISKISLVSEADKIKICKKNSNVARLCFQPNWVQFVKRKKKLFQCRYWNYTKYNEEKNWDRELIGSVSITFAWTKTNVNSLSPFFVMSYASLSYQLSISLHLIVATVNIAHSYYLYSTVYKGCIEIFKSISCSIVSFLSTTPKKFKMKVKT